MPAGWAVDGVVELEPITIARLIGSNLSGITGIDRNQAECFDLRRFPSPKGFCGSRLRDSIDLALDTIYHNNGRGRGLCQHARAVGEHIGVVSSERRTKEQEI